MMADPPYNYSHQPIQRKPMPTHLQPDRQSPMSPTYSHSRSRTTSSSVLPDAPAPKINYPPPPAPQTAYTSRRTPSTNTFSTTASSGRPGANSPLPTRQSNTDLRRSISSRSGGAAPPSGYVALMRKQKATVWCDRAQQEDPRIVAAHKMAKMRAAKEVLGGAGSGVRTLTAQSGGSSIVGSNRVTAKIRHHGKAALVGYSPVENFGVGVGGVPMRLSATEVENGDSEEEDAFPHHHRSGSGRSSLGSARRNNMPYRQSGASGTSGRWSQGNTPPGERGSMTDLAGTTQEGRAADARSTRSGSSGERNDSVAELAGGGAGPGGMMRSAVRREKSLRNPEELRRRGSVDERTMTMSAQRLYIANPDEDSD